MALLVIVIRSVVFLATSVQGVTLCRACLRILICGSESERAEGADRLALPQRCDAGMPPPPPPPGEGERELARSNSQPDDRWDNVLLYQSRTCSCPLFSVVEGRLRVPSVPHAINPRHLRGPAALPSRRVQPHPTNGPDQDASNTSQIARHGT